MNGPSFEVKRAQVEDWLHRIADLRRIMDEHELEIERCRNILDVAGIRYTDMPGNPNVDTDKIPRAVVSLIEAQEAYREIVASFDAQYHNAWNVCHVAGDPERTMLWDFHVERMTWEEVGVKFGYVDKAINRAALRGVEGIWNDMPASERYIPKADA